MVGCGDSKMPQCIKLTATANKLKSVAAPKDTSDLSLLADRIDSIRIELQKVELQDSKLKDLQAKLVAIYVDSLLVLKDKSKALITRDSIAFKKADRAIEEIIARENSVVSEINNFCGQ
ncbi:hypothetical protein TUMEXPCC7403_02655 [Tumidithrix helvetica PCC 7403]